MKAWAFLNYWGRAPGLFPSKSTPMIRLKRCDKKSYSGQAVHCDNLFDTKYKPSLTRVQTLTLDDRQIKCL